MWFWEKFCSADRRGSDLNRQLGYPKHKLILLSSLSPVVDMFRRSQECYTLCLFQFSYGKKEKRKKNQINVTWIKNMVVFLLVNKKVQNALSYIMERTKFFLKILFILHSTLCLFGKVQTQSNHHCHHHLAIVFSPIQCYLSQNKTQPQ